MNMSLILRCRLPLAAAACLVACTPKTEEVGELDDTAADSDGSASATGGDTATATTTDPTATSSGSATSGDSTSTTATGGETGTDTGGETGTDTDATTTGIDVGEFERFRFDTAAGPCPPGSDCDGYVELLADGTLNVEVFGDVTNTVQTAQVSAQDLADAAAVFTDPALVVLLDAADPPCKPPTDIFENMLLEADGITYDNSVTGCDDAAILSARTMAMQLQDTYVP